MLRDQCRWEEVTIALGTGRKHLKMACIYGYDGASSDPQRYRLNEDLLARALLRQLEAGDTPYLICADLNIKPEDSNAISNLLAKNLLCDVPAAYGLGGSILSAKAGPKKMSKKKVAPESTPSSRTTPPQPSLKDVG